MWRIIERAGTIATIAISAWAAAQGSIESKAGELRINQIQVIGTHNSYHLRNTKGRGGKPASKEWDYEHRPIDEQLENGVRSFELDLHLHPDGWRVYHVPRLDSGSTCPLLTSCLETVKRWQAAHPRSVPITFLCEMKEEGMQLDKSILDFDAKAADALDAEIRSVFGPDRLIAPDDVRGGAPTLAEAVRTRGWPALEASRGTVLFILHEDGKYRDVYVAGRPSLQGRAMFVRSAEGRPDCATLVEDTPDVERIKRLVKAGYFVRTRADGRLQPGLAPEGMTREAAALLSGAQIVSTDDPPGEPDARTGRTVALPGGAAARANPVNAEGGGADLER